MEILSAKMQQSKTIYQDLPTSLSEIIENIHFIRTYQLKYPETF
jgi:hypothetical protein